MKSKPTATVLMFVCVMLFAAHAAQAFYNPSTGRWLNRDPIGEAGGRSAFCFVENAPVSHTDVLGLISARAKIERRMMLLFTEFTFFKSIEATGYLNAMARYRNLIPSIGYNEESLSGVAALYDPYDNVLTIDKDTPDVPFNTIAHEFAHVYNDLVLRLHPRRDDRIDEGMGYAMASFTMIAFDLQGIELAVRQDCQDAHYRGGLRWQAFWSKWGVIPNKNWGPVVWDGGDKSADLAKSDLTGLAQNHGVTLGCKAIASELNNLLSQRQCCFRFTCAVESSATEVGTGTRIDGFLQ